MLTKQTKFRKWITLSAVLGLLAFIFYPLFFTNFTEVGIVIAKTNITIYVLAFVCVVVASAFDALAWKSTLDPLAVKTTFRRIFILSWIGQFVDTLIPGGLSGDVFKTYLLTKDKDINGSKAAVSIIIKDALELVVVLGSLIVGIAFLALNYSVNITIVVAIGITVVLLALPLVLVVCFSLNTGVTEKILRAIERVSARIKGKEFKSAALQEKVHSRITEFRDGIISVKSNPKATETRFPLTLD